MGQIDQSKQMKKVRMGGLDSTWWVNVNIEERGYSTDKFQLTVMESFLYTTWYKLPCWNHISLREQCFYYAQPFYRWKKEMHKDLVTAGQLEKIWTWAVCIIFDFYCCNIQLPMSLWFLLTKAGTWEKIRDHFCTYCSWIFYRISGRSILLQNWREREKGTKDKRTICFRDSG